MNPVKALRLSLGLTTRQLAQMIGVTPSAVRKWQGGRCRPGNMVVAFLDALEKNPTSPPPPLNGTRTCACGKEFPVSTRHPNQRHCSDTCRSKYGHEPERRRKTAAAWRRKNPEKMKKYAKAHAAYRIMWVKRNPDKVKAALARYRERHPEKLQTDSDARRAKRAAMGLDARQADDRKKRHLCKAKQVELEFSLLLGKLTGERDAG